MNNKKAILLLSLLLCAAALCACGRTATGEADTAPLDTPDYLCMTITEVGSAGVRYTVKSEMDGEATCGTGADVSLQVLRNGSWYPFKKDYDVTQELWYIPTGYETEFTFFWYDIYGTLPAGTYRLVKTIGCSFTDGSFQALRLGQEFTIA